jgi:hypothetical protein
MAREEGVKLQEASAMCTLLPHSVRARVQTIPTVIFCYIHHGPGPRRVPLTLQLFWECVDEIQPRHKHQ